MTHALKWTALAVISASTLIGCETPKPAPPPPPVTGFIVPDQRSESTSQMVPHTNQFSQVIAQMPGGSGAEHRQLLVNALTELSLILRLANGSVQSPEFVNRIGVIDAATRTAGMPSIPRARMEAVENQALQSAYQALAEITTRYLFDDDQLPPMLGVINDKITLAAGVMGPMHDLDATEAFRAVQIAVQRVTDDMLARFTANGTPADETPAPAVTPPPAAIPATPTTAPTTMQ